MGVGAVLEQRFEHGFDAGVVDELAAGGASGLHEDYEREGLGGGGLEGDLLRDGVVGEGEVVGGEGVDDFFGGGLDEGGDDYEGGGGVEGGVAGFCARVVAAMEVSRAAWSRVRMLRGF